MASIESVTGPLDAEDLGDDPHPRAPARARRGERACSSRTSTTRTRSCGRGRGREGGGRPRREDDRRADGDAARPRRRASSRASREETGLQAIACTGIYTYDYLPLFWQSRVADAMADAFVHDIEQGIQGTDIKAALPQMRRRRAGRDRERREDPPRLRAREPAHRRADHGPLAARVATPGPRQVEILLEEGVAPEKIQIAHTGDTDDLDYIEGLLEKGVYIGLDRFGIEMYLPIEKRIPTTLALLERGYAERMFISADSCASIDWFPEETVERLMARGRGEGLDDHAGARPGRPGAAGGRA